MDGSPVQLMAQAACLESNTRGWSFNAQTRPHGKPALANRLVIFQDAAP
jgi:hypothetical protein